MALKLSDLDRKTRQRLKLAEDVRDDVRPHKFRAHPCYVDRIGQVIDLAPGEKPPKGSERFDSRREASRWVTLRAREIVGEITHLKRQHRFRLYAPRADRRMVVITTYVADFVYWDTRTGQRVVEDAKGYKTPIYKMKKRWLLVQEGIEILET